MLNPQATPLVPQRQQQPLAAAQPHGAQQQHQQMVQQQMPSSLAGLPASGESVFLTICHFR